MKTGFTEKELLERRLSGVLPTINIAGQEFTVNIQAAELRAADDITTRIKLEGLHLMPDANHYYCYYNTVIRQVEKIQTDSTKLPKDTVMLIFPNEKGLDPVGTARKYGLPDDALLPAYPIQVNMAALVIPLDRTPFAETVKQNRQQKHPKNWIGKIIKRTKGKGKGL